MSFATHPDPNEILRAPGYLHISPTGFATESDWGVKLGFAERGVSLTNGYNVQLLTGHERGDAVKRVIYTSGVTRLTAQLLNFNEDVLAAAFPGLSSALTLNYPGSIKPGKDLLTYAKPILFVPSDRVNNPVVLLQLAVPHISGDALFSRVTPTIWTVNFIALRKTLDPDGTLYLGAIGGAVLR